MQSADSLDTVAGTINCRLMCASADAYGIDTLGNYTPRHPYSDAVGWSTAHPPVAVASGDDDIDACLIGANVDGIIVAFRGTLPPYPVTVPSLLDWWQDLIDATPERVGNIPGNVHSGFWDALSAIWDGIVTQIANFREWFPDAQIYITGHSKGGGMAPICAANLHFNYPEMFQAAAVHTFAGPHAGDTDFAAAFPLSSIPVTRYENYLDIVPLLPPTEEFIGVAAKIPYVGDLFKRAEGWNYAPVGTLQYIEQDHDIIDDNPFLTDLRLGELAFVMARGESGLRQIAAAHSLQCGGGYAEGICPSGLCS